MAEAVTDPGLTSVCRADTSIPDRSPCLAPRHGRNGELAAGAEAVDALRTDLDDHASLARTQIGVLVLAQVLLRQHVYVVERALLDELGRAAHHHVAGL